MHEKRIGELHLKVEQSAFYETECRRQTEKMKSMEENNKIVED
jgi:hypothetical protein